MKTMTKRFVCITIVMVLLFAMAVPIASATDQGWYRQGNAWYYDGVDDSGRPVRGGGEFSIGGTWYYFHSNGAMATGWIAFGTEWKYFHSNGARAIGTVIIDGVTYVFDHWGYLATEIANVRNGWHTQNNLRYFFRNGAMQYGWQFIDGHWYYFNLESGAMTTGWQIHSGTVYFFLTDGRMATGFVQVSTAWHTPYPVNNAWYYFHPANGAMATGWLQLGTARYYLNENTGARVSGRATVPGWGIQDFSAEGVWLGQAVEMWNGWYQLDGTYYFYRIGEPVSGWLLDGGAWYYLASNGSMYTNQWITDPNTGLEYFLNASGIMATGWVLYQGNWYYTSASGAKVIGEWILDRGTWYYLTSPNGVMATGSVRIAGVIHNFNASGAWLGQGGAGGGNNAGQLGGGWQLTGGNWVYNVGNTRHIGWLLDRGTWYYLDPANNGIMVTGWKPIDGARYFFTGTGAMATGWIFYNGSWYFLQSSGAMLTNGWIQGTGGAWYWLKGDGTMAAGETIPIEGALRTFRADGTWVG